MTYDMIIASIEDHIGIIELNRPEALNALNDRLLGELADAMNLFLQNNEVRCIIISGGEKSFCAGADLKEMVSRESRDMLDRFTSSIFGLLRQCPKPTIAAVSGYCFAGGCELALACDMIVALQERPVWTTGNQCRNHARSWRYAALDPHSGQSPGDGGHAHGRPYRRPKSLGMGYCQSSGVFP